MKFRATLHGVPNLERPKVQYSNFKEWLDAWAKLVLTGQPDEAYVVIEENAWTEVGRVGTI